MNYREQLHHADDYIDRAGDGVGWGPIVVGIVIIAMLGLLFFVPSRQSDKTSNSRQSEIITPAGPSSQLPLSPNPK